MPSPDERTGLVEAFWAAYEEGDEARLRELCADGFRFDYADGRTFTLEEWLAKARSEREHEKFDDLQVELEEFVTGDERVVVRGRHVRTQVERFVGVDPDDEPVRLPFCDVFAFEGDEIAAVHATENEGEFLRGVGVLPGDGLAWKLRQQHREVLNRVLRHNLRNDLNAALLRAGQVADDALRGQIRRPIDRLLDMVEKTRRVEQHVVEQDRYPESVAVADVVRSAVESVRRQSAGGEFVAEVEGDATLRTDPDILETVLVECIDNAATHGEGPVAVTVAARDDGATVEVADEGGGVPKYELAPIRQEKETAIVHGSGVGLWAIKWGVERLDGDLAFETPDGDGTVVRMDLPDLA